MTRSTDCNWIFLSMDQDSKLLLQKKLVTTCATPNPFLSNEICLSRYHDWLIVSFLAMIPINQYRPITSFCSERAFWIRIGWANTTSLPFNTITVKRPYYLSSATPNPILFTIFLEYFCISGNACVVYLL